MSEQFELPTYKTPPPYGGTTLDWCKFFLRPHRWPLTLWFIQSMLRQGGFRTHPFFLGVVIGMVESGRAADDPAALAGWIGIYLGLLALLFLAIVFYIPVGTRIDRISKEVALYGFQHYLRLPESWHEENASGEKLQRLTGARQYVFEILEHSYWHIVTIPAVAIVITASLTILGAPPYYLALYLGYITTYMACAFVTGGWLHKRFETYNETLEKVVGGVYEFIVSTATVRFFNLKDHVLQKGRQLEVVNHNARRAIFKTVCKRWLVMDFLAWGWMATIIALASYEVVHGTLSVSAYSALLFFNLTLWTELEFFAIIYKDMIERWEGLKRLTAILNQKPTITDAPDAKKLCVQSPSIQFDHVSFHYHKNKRVIDGFDLNINGGEKIGILGPSGAGKSTIIKLLLRFYDAQSGALRIDGQDVKAVTLESLQQAIAVIPQDVTLFNHPLIENIRYGRLEASDAQVIEAAKKAHAHDFITQLPDGYDTLVGERGVKLSGGQRQRIAIARAILKDAPILILDEATSALDSESETLIQQSLEELMVGKTVIAIAHRLSTIAHLDRLIVMEGGTIVEQGTHEALCKNDQGLYAKLWSMQSGGFLGE